MDNSIQLNVEMSPELYETMIRLALTLHCSQADILRRSMTLFEVAVQATHEGKHIGIAADASVLETEFVGL